MGTEIKKLTPDMHLKKIRCKIQGIAIDDAIIFTEYWGKTLEYFIFQNHVDGMLPESIEDLRDSGFKYSYYIGNSVYTNKHYAETIDSIQFIEEPKKTFPRKMLVWDEYERGAVEKLVFDIIDPRFKYNVICIYEDDEDDFIRRTRTDFQFSYFKNAKELPEIPKLTLEQVKDKLGFDFELIE